MSEDVELSKEALDIRPEGKYYKAEIPELKKTGKGKTPTAAIVDALEIVQKSYDSRNSRYEEEIKNLDAKILAMQSRRAALADKIEKSGEDLLVYKLLSDPFLPWYLHEAEALATLRDLEVKMKRDIQGVLIVENPDPEPGEMNFIVGHDFGEFITGLALRRMVVKSKSVPTEG